MTMETPEVYRLDHFRARRKVFKLLGAGFTLETTDGRPLARSEQKAFRLKEDIRINEPGGDGAELLRIKADRIVDFSAAYRVDDAQTGEHIGTLRRKGWSSMFKDSWEILDADGVVRGKVVEESTWKALARRFVDAASLFLPQTFNIEVDGQVVGSMRQHFNPFIQKFDVDLSQDTDQLLPRPLAVATVVLLLAIEGRQRG
ncbi:hypothetical protein TA3x_004539 [Tundrisphaera sp. TA3]|uniref:hypothetical protein n=1 Tax=Tundrisphaera sp. TA3 TaxID=3435775 RepID=UPI003EBC1441